MERENRVLQILKWMIGPALILGAILLLNLSVSNLETGQDEESLKQLTNAIHRAAVSCYATEGVYPPTLEYIEEHYGIQVDQKRFTVFYQVFGDNMMPDITVLPK